jgi:hypothetical protein
VQDTLEELKQILFSEPVELSLGWWDVVAAVDSLFTQQDADARLLKLLEYEGPWPVPPMPTHAMPPQELMKHRALLRMHEHWKERSPEVRANYQSALDKVEKNALSPQLKELAKQQDG